MEVTASGAFQWFNSDGRTFNKPGQDRWLYQWRERAWWYVDNKAHRCRCCQAIVFVQSHEPCPHCGAAP